MTKKFIYLFILLIGGGCTIREDYNMNREQTVDQCLRERLYAKCITTRSRANMICEDVSIKLSIRLRVNVKPDCRYD